MNREEAIKYFKRHLDLYCVDGISREAEEMAIKALEQESKTGRWIDKDDKSAVCSCCNRNNTLFGDYCKWCGARMESDHKCHTCKHYTSGEHDGSCDSYICEGYSDWESEEV